MLPFLGGFSFEFIAHVSAFPFFEFFGGMRSPIATVVSSLSFFIHPPCNFPSACDQNIFFFLCSVLL